jgi:hypothetical protein
MFKYQPIGAADLPYFDQAPLVFPFNKTAQNFTGLNMHYLNPRDRFALFTALLKIKGSTTITDSRKLVLTWEMIKGVSTLAPAQACIKQYRIDAMRSQFIEIPPSDWATAMILPSDAFQKATNTAVWRDSKRNFRGW